MTKQKVAVLTGASSGIGQAIKNALENSGWVVLGPDRKELDLAEIKSIEKFVKNLPKEHHQINAVIHVAGIWHGKTSAHANKDLEDFSVEQIENTMNVGVVAPMILLAKLLPRIPKEGVIIGISGTFADGANGWLPYYTSKRALEDFLVGLSQDYPSGPYVYGISPADTATPAYKKFYPEYAARAQSPEAVAQEVAMLLQSHTYKSGTILEVRNGEINPAFHS